jgi:tetratricopeptide (TPR) repeat protein
VTQLAFSPQGQLATGAGDRAVRLWDIQSGRTLAPPIRHPFQVNNIAMPANNRIYICSDQNVYVRDLATLDVPLESVAQSVRLLTNQTLSTEKIGFRTAGADQLAQDWQAIDRFKGALFASSDDQIDQWYERVLNQLHRDRDWSAATHHRQYFIKRHPGDPFMLGLQAEAFAENGQFQKAAEHLRKQLDLGPQDETWILYQLASALIASDDGEQLEGLLDDFVAKAKDTSEPYVAERLGKLLLLTQKSTDDPSLPGRLADIALQGRPTNGWFIVTKALSSTRMGDHQASIKHCDSVINSQINNIIRPLAFSVRSIANAAAGHAQAAQADLQQVRQHRERLNLDQATGVWLDRIHLDLLTKEAQAAADHSSQ